MFHHYPNISPDHHVALESAVRSHMAEPEDLAKLYSAALGALLTPEKPPLGILASTLRDGKMVVATATNVKTGIYVQLAQMPEQPRPWLTVGQKWAMESPNLAMGNVATRIW